MERAKAIITDKNSNVRVYLIKKTRGKGTHTASIFPNDINKNIKATYRENFVNFYNDKEVCEYDGVHHEIDTIQTVPTMELDEWNQIKKAIETAESRQIFLNKKNFTDDYTLLVVLFELSSNSNIHRTYFVAKYRKTDVWYKNSIKFTFIGGILKEVEKDIFILNGCIDAVISNKNTYILMPRNFESIFNYYKKSEEILINNKNNIKGWNFLDNPMKFYNSIHGKKTATLKMVRVLQKSLAVLNSLSSKEVKSTLTKYDEFKNIYYDKQDRIVVTDKNRDLIIDILRNVYAKNIFNDELIHTKGT